MRLIHHVTALLFLCLSSGVNALVIYDLTVAAEFTGTGQITFLTDSGNSVAGVSAFQFTATEATTGTINLGLTDIDTISWAGALDSILDSFQLIAANVPGGLLDATGIGLSLSTPSPSIELGPGCGGVSAFSFNSIYRGCNSAFSGAPLQVNTGGNLVATAAVVPSPATLALFGLGLAGLGWSRRKKV